MRNYRKGLLLAHKASAPFFIGKIYLKFSYKNYEKHNSWYCNTTKREVYEHFLLSYSFCNDEATICVSF